MPVSVVQKCTYDAVKAAYEERQVASYTTDANEDLAINLGFDRNDANLVFQHTNRLVREKWLSKLRETAEPVRYHDRGNVRSIVRRVTFRVM